MFDYSLEHITSFWARLEPPQTIGPTPEGMRVVFPVRDGELTGPKLRGTVLQGGGDWLTIRKDGIQVLDVRATTKTDDGALVYTEYSGIGDLSEDGYERFIRGDVPETIELRAAARYHTADPRYAWLNRLQCLLIGRADSRELKVSYDVYAVR